MIQLKPLIVSAPFGNYIQPKYATATLGTFTRFARPPGTAENPAKGGRLLQILKTVRYNPFKRSWRNKIGLRNPGINWLIKRNNNWTGFDENIDQKIVSVHGFNVLEWIDLLRLSSALSPLAIEINVSCPNVAIHNPMEVLDYLKNADKTPVIVKLPPIGYEQIVDTAWLVGVRCFHACNTIPSPKGGISGKPLKPLAIKAVSWIKQKYGNAAQVIGGGGVTSAHDILEYQDAGADHVSVASCLFFPWNILKFSMLAKKMWNIRHSMFRKVDADE